eukprot:scaffold298_cov63-Phaeocystis_antarctica.AAC.1
MFDVWCSEQSLRMLVVRFRVDLRDPVHHRRKFSQVLSLLDSLPVDADHSDLGIAIEGAVARRAVADATAWLGDRSGSGPGPGLESGKGSGVRAQGSGIRGLKSEGMPSCEHERPRDEGGVRGVDPLPVTVALDKEDLGAPVVSAVLDRLFAHLVEERLATHGPVDARIVGDV